MLGKELNDGMVWVGSGRNNRSERIVADTQSRKGIHMSETLSTGTTGALNEYVACTHLMRMGVEVYRACSPSSSCDLIGILNGHVFRIEVRTAIDGWSFPFGDKDIGRQDCVCAVRADGSTRFYAVTNRCPAAVSTLPMPERKRRVLRRREWKVHKHAFVGRTGFYSGIQELYPAFQNNRAPFPALLTITRPPHSY